jgi:hypothetical protein
VVNRVHSRWSQPKVFAESLLCQATSTVGAFAWTAGERSARGRISAKPARQTAKANKTPSPSEAIAAHTSTSELIKSCMKPQNSVAARSAAGNTASSRNGAPANRFHPFLHPTASTLLPVPH